jgi:hypothetical protein
MPLIYMRMQKKIKQKNTQNLSFIHFTVKKHEKTNGKIIPKEKQIISIFYLVLISNKQVQLDIDTSNLVIPMTFDQDQFV